MKTIPLSQTSMTPIADWQAAKEMREKGEEKLKYIPSKYGNSWKGMGPKANRRWERYERRIDKIVSHYQDIVEADGCPGCGDYSPEGHPHNNPSCQYYARFKG